MRLVGKLYIYTTENKELWNEIVVSFTNWDIYYLCEYAEALQLHGDGEPLLVYYINGDFRLCYVVMQEDIGKNTFFIKALEGEKWFDWETPYGYGGYLTEGDVSDSISKDFGILLDSYCRENHVVSEFVRFHPFLKNNTVYRKEEKCKIETFKDVIFMDTSDRELIFKNLDSKNRNMIRKAVKNDVHIIADEGENYKEFLRVYNKTMNFQKAEEYYYFQREYFEFLINKLKGHIKFFYALYEGKVISSSIFIYNNKYMHYFLSGTDRDYKQLGSANLLLYQAACFACEKGIEKLLLGGGVEAEDSLFGFKKQFNREGRIPFYIGRTIFNQKMYDQLIVIRSEIDESFDTNNGRLIAYKA